MGKNLILASNSPRRRELLSLLGFEFSVMPSQIDEDEILKSVKNASDVPAVLAKKKAEKQTIADGDVVLACDTVVILDGHIMGKPKSRDDAKKMLTLLSDKTHEVISAVCIKSNEKTVEFSGTASVTFFELSESEIEWYLDTKEPFDKAGAYGIQGKGSYLVKSICGDYFSIVGLPLAAVARELSCFGISKKEEQKNEL